MDPLRLVGLKLEAYLTTPEMRCLNLPKMDSSSSCFSSSPPNSPTRPVSSSTPYLIHHTPYDVVAQLVIQEGCIGALGLGDLLEEVGDIFLSPRLPPLKVNVHTLSQDGLHCLHLLLGHCTDECVILLDDGLHLHNQLQLLLTLERDVLYTPKILFMHHSHCSI